MTPEEKSKKKSYAKFRSEGTEKRVVVKLGEKETLKELEEKRKAFEKLGKQFSSLIPSDSIRAWERYKALSQEISKQVEPMKKALEQLNAVYSGSIQNSLAPVLQRLTESIKPIEEQMKRLKPLFEHPEYPKEAFISSDVIRTRQGAETISKLENIEALLQGLLSKDKEKPMQVEIVKPEEFKIKGLEKGLGAIAKAKKEKEGNKFPHKLPAGTEWKHFIIQFLNKEEVFVQVNRFKDYENYVNMRFVDNRFAKPRPNEGWTFLWVLAKYNGELTIRDPEAKDTYKKQKGLVSETLKFYFRMETDPFYPYQETKSYKTRFTLLPPPEEPSDKIKKHQIPQTEVEQDSVDDEIKQFFKEQTPQVYDERG